jgi:8-oxo-dGTP diphosphatase
LALIRELEEELGIRCIADDLTAFVFASHTYENFHLLMPLYLIRQWQGEIRLKEHKALVWVYAKDMPNYPMPPADKPLVDYLLKLAFLDP